MPPRQPATLDLGQPRTWRPRPSGSPRLLGLARQTMVDSGIDFDDVLAGGRILESLADEVIRAGSDVRPTIDLELRGHR